jgi:hypothetical protein
LVAEYTDEVGAVLERVLPDRARGRCCRPRPAAGAESSRRVGGSDGGSHRDVDQVVGGLAGVSMNIIPSRRPGA